jgi:hypothetical protein
MAEVIPAEEQSNYETFRDYMSEPVVKALALPEQKEKNKKKRIAKKRAKYKPVGMFAPIKPQIEAPSTGDAPSATDAEDLGEFIDACVQLLRTSNNQLTTYST